MQKEKGSLQINKKLVKELKLIALKLCEFSETYYHSILLFHLIKIKKKAESKNSFQMNPKRKETCSSRPTPYFQWNSKHKKINQSEKPKEELLQLFVCFLLAYKIHENNYDAAIFSKIMEQFQLDKSLTPYIFQLEVEFLILLKYKVENLLPSNEAIFAMGKWDNFMENISDSCFDVRFCTNEENLKALIKNIELIIHNEAIYNFYVEKSQLEEAEKLHPMKKIGLGILYVTIFEQSEMMFRKKYGRDIECQLKNETKFIEFVFNDFLVSEYGIKLDEIEQEVSICQFILEKQCQNKCKSLKIKEKDNLFKTNVTKFRE